MDPTATVCEAILKTIRQSGLNWSIEESPFSLSISIRKSFVKKYEDLTKLEVAQIPNQVSQNSTSNNPSYEYASLSQNSFKKDPFCPFHMKYPIKPLMSLSPTLLPNQLSNFCHQFSENESSLTKPLPDQSSSVPMPQIDALPISLQTIPPLLTNLAKFKSSFSPNNQIRKKTSPNSKIRTRTSPTKQFMDTASSTNSTSPTTQFKDTTSPINKFRNTTSPTNQFIDNTSPTNQFRATTSQTKQIRNTTFPTKHFSKNTSPTNDIRNATSSTNQEQTVNYPSRELKHSTSSLEDTMDSINQLRERYRRLKLDGFPNGTGGSRPHPGIK